MIKSILAVAVLALSLGIGGCASQSRAEKVGTAGGAAAGVYLGDKAGEAYDRHNR